MANQDPKRVITGKVRLSYCNILKPRPARNPGEDEKYSVTLLIPKSDTATKQRIDAAIQAAIQEGAQGKWNGASPAQPPTPLHDGDGLRQSGDAYPAECKGHWVLTASSLQKPDIVDLSLQPIINPTEIYSGMYAHVSVQFFAYNSNGKKGIGAGLGNVQKVCDGEPLAGGASAADDFGSLSAQPIGYSAPAVPAQPTYQPVYQPPQMGYDPMTGQVMGL